MQSVKKIQKKQTIPLVNKNVLFTLLLFAITLIFYYPAWNGTPIWDDDHHITRLELRSLDGLGRIWTELGATQQYYPLVHSVFWLAYHLWGDSPLLHIHRTGYNHEKCERLQGFFITDLLQIRKYSKLYNAKSILTTSS